MITKVKIYASAVRHIQQFIAFLLLSPSWQRIWFLLSCYSFFFLTFSALLWPLYSALVMQKNTLEPNYVIRILTFKEKYQLSQTTSTNRLFTFWSRTQWTQYDRIPPLVKLAFTFVNALLLKKASWEQKFLLSVQVGQNPCIHWIWRINWGKTSLNVILSNIWKL